MKVINIYALNINDVKDEFIDLMHTDVKEKIYSIKNEKARKESIASEILLYYAVKCLKPENISLPPLRQIDEFGKPYFSLNKNFCFNISHSGDLAVIAVCDSPIGIDIQKIKNNKTSVAKRILSDYEKQNFFKMSPEHQVQSFYEYWVLKESIVKAMGVGIRYGLNKFSIKLGDKPELKAGYTGEIQIFIHELHKLYKLGVCILSKDEYKIFVNTLSYNQIMM